MWGLVGLERDGDGDLCCGEGVFEMERIVYNG